ncbi:MAG: hypothetical protein RLZZ381_2694, partial [Cyanobacteriota bacterium]
MRSLYYLFWLSLFNLLIAPTALAESRSPLAHGSHFKSGNPPNVLPPLEKGGTRIKVLLENGKTALKVPLLKGDLGGSLAQNPQQLTKVTGVEVKQTLSG